MRITKWLLSLMIILPATAAEATEPCRYYDEPAFIENVLKPADLVVYAEITDYSKRDEGPAELQWTGIKVLSPLFSKRGGKVDMHVAGWQAHQMPMYPYNVGDRVVLFLKAEHGHYVLAKDEWLTCTPSIWNANKEEKTYQGYKPASAKADWISINDVRAWIMKNK
ncbi:MAG: hypothetical protein EB060_04680 [Proteobacteria bacterium]|nr:hypothetical protein [Pseudomonadota bacterium]